MLKILEVAEEIYMKKGREEGKEEFLWRQLNRKFPKIDASYYGKIKKLDSIKLDVLSIEILDMKKLEELDTYL